MKEITVDGIVYVPKEEKLIGKKFVLIRTYSAGVHFGDLEKKAGMEVTLTNARRIWYWEGAFTLSEIAMTGVQYPKKCKFSICVDRIILEAIEIIDISEKAKKILEEIEPYAK